MLYYLQMVTLFSIWFDGECTDKRNCYFFPENLIYTKVYMYYLDPALNISVYASGLNIFKWIYGAFIYDLNCYLICGRLLICLQGIMENLWPAFNVSLYEVFCNIIYMVRWGIYSWQELLYYLQMTFNISSRPHGVVIFEIKFFFLQFLKVISK